ncbi:hypothetical protein LCGC14_0666580 [marine sediment metagenome]|uniref:Uncharacterized protein n=1 Tax=marine sediment metagenome TaxID=412755 RepID=A0A0F9RC98_9ZZZZ
MILITIGIGISQVFLQILKSKREKVQLRQNQEKIDIERNKYNFSLLSKVLSGDTFGKSIQDWIDDPEKLKDFYTKVMKFSGDMQEFYDKENKTRKKK